LGEYCLTLGKRSAADAWRIGTAVNMAKPIVKAAGQSFLAWKAKYLPKMANSTIARYCGLAEKTTLDAIKDMNLMQACYHCGQDTEPTPKAKPDPSQDKTDWRTVGMPAKFAPATLASEITDILDSGRVKEFVGCKELVKRLWEALNAS
jgi:hypothetical protein